jgi:demethylsterigmatocystin 6-O-methyltransferase
MIVSGFDSIFPSIIALPAFLKSTGYKNITDPYHTAMQYAFKTSLSAFEYLAQPGNEAQLAAFQATMIGRQDADGLKKLPLLRSAIEAATATHNGDSSKGATEMQAEAAPFLVDVAGGHGHQLSYLLKTYPALKGKLVLEDLPEVINQIEPKSLDGVKLVPQDIFKEQTIKGAKFYYVRQIIHDWPDKPAALILTNLAAAMGPESRILCDDIALPEMNMSPGAACLDVALMTHFAGGERTRGDWKELVASVVGADGRGLLEIEEVFEYDREGHICVTVLKLR